MDGLGAEAGASVSRRSSRVPGWVRPREVVTSVLLAPPRTHSQVNHCVSGLIDQASPNPHSIAWKAGQVQRGHFDHAPCMTEGWGTWSLRTFCIPVQKTLLQNLHVSLSKLQTTQFSVVTITAVCG